MRTLLLIISCLSILGCHTTQDRPGIADRDVYLKTYCDLVQESLRSKNSNADPRTAAANVVGIYRKYGITRSQFDSTTKWFNNDVRRWKSFFDDAAKEIELRELNPSPSIRQPS
jgi:hypothetical protein